MYVKPIPACPSCFGDQKEHGIHKTWEDCQAQLSREDLQSPARFARSGSVSKAWTGDRRQYA